MRSTKVRLKKKNYHVKAYVEMCYSHTENMSDNCTNIQGALFRSDKYTSPRNFSDVTLRVST
jgi:hypothetical protein